METLSIPLQCSICPRKPHFSDISHLLTHVASKGHLSFYYKLKVRASQDQEALVQVDAYDRWYLEWDVEKLMSDRMRQKDKRRSRGRFQARAPKPYVDTLNVDPELASTATRPQRPKSENAAPLFPAAMLSPFRPKRPRLYLWSTKYPLSCTAMLLSSDDCNYSPQLDSKNMITGDVSVSELGSDGIEKSNKKSPGSGNEMTKLKGVIWPGMDIFDSATPYMRRKRNQKKETSVLERLEQHSLQVDPIEKIYTHGGELRKQRKITGRVDFSSSPEFDFRSSPLIDAPTSRRPLQDKDVNVPSLCKVPSRPVKSSRPQKQHSAAAATAVELPAKQVKKRKKASIDVFRDDTKPFGHPSGMPLLTSEFHYSPQVNEPLQQDTTITQYGPALQHSSTFLDQGYGTYQTYYYPAGHAVFGIPAYDLSALLAQVAGFAPVRQTASNDQDTTEAERLSNLANFSEAASEARDD